MKKNVRNNNHDNDILYVRNICVRMHKDSWEKGGDCQVTKVFFKSVILGATSCKQIS